MSEIKNKLSEEERVIADEVADDLLTVSDDRNRKYFALVLLFLLCLIFLVSSLSFAIFSTFYNGTLNNVVDVNVGYDGTNKDKDKDKPSNNGNGGSTNNQNSTENNGQSGNNVDNQSGGNNQKPEEKPGDNDKPGGDVPGLVYFSFNSGSNYINMKNVVPTDDAVGMALTGDKEYFDFNVSTTINEASDKKMYYEISVVPSEGNTISEDDIRIYLTENGEAVSNYNNKVSTFSDLEISEYHTNGRVIYSSAVNTSTSIDYVFRMWLSSDAEDIQHVRKFACRIMVDAYYK